MSRITGSDAEGLINAYNSVYAPQELTEDQIWEEVEKWVNSLVEEGYDLSEYTWEDMYEEYLNEMGRTATTGQMTAPRPAAQSPKPAPAAYNPAGGGMGGGRGSRGPQQSTKPVPTPSRFGTTTPRGSSVTSTGVSGLSAADRAAYSAGGGNAAAQRGMGRTTSQVIAQGRANLGRMDQGRPAPATARPTSGPSSTNPKSGLSAFPAAKPASAAGAAKPATVAAAKPAVTKTAPPTRVMTDGSAAGKPSAAPAAVAKKPSLAAQAAELRQMQAASRQRQGLTQSFDPFDVVMGYLIDEGYADTEEAALQIMANMSEEWKKSILEG